MSDGIYKIITCDRCGLELRIEKSKADQMMTRLPKNWGVAPGKAHKTDLCPRCFSEFKILVANFMEEVKNDNERLDQQMRALQSPGYDTGTGRGE